MRNRFLSVSSAALVCLLLPRMLLAQSSPAESFAAFLRVAGTTGQALASLKGIWPYPLNERGEYQREWQITGAHRISVDVNTYGDTSRVSGVRWHERVADTASLRRRVTELHARLEQASGPAERCNDPLGPPAYLFSPQHVERVWTRGVAGAPTRLTWVVSSNAVYEISIDVGLFPDDRPLLRSCEPKAP